MIQELHPEVIAAVGSSKEEYSMTPITTGLINYSFKIVGNKSNNAFLLQKINSSVFPEPEKLQYNYSLLWNYINDNQINFQLPEPIRFNTGKTTFNDEENNFWRLFSYIENSKTVGIASSPTVAYNVAREFANFTLAFKEFDSRLLAIPIQDFHNLSLRFSQFETTLKNEKSERKGIARELITELLNRSHYTRFFEKIKEGTDFRKRVMHHDAKISNVLFSVLNGNIICPVDYDTTMPGYFISDLGDMIRSMSCNQDENSNDDLGIFVKRDYYEAIVNGYLSKLKNELTAIELTHIHSAGLLMIYMQALRFLTDYLNNDIYYRINYLTQNFDRAKNQLLLLKSLEGVLKTTYSYELNH